MARWARWAIDGGPIAAGRLAIGERRENVRDGFSGSQPKQAADSGEFLL
ncbi:hypothetical protein [Paenibacillus taihuensis]|nr:hypothetical protein [Paenibacillus taihuensis]